MPTPSFDAADGGSDGRRRRSLPPGGSPHRLPRPPPVVVVAPSSPSLEGAAAVPVAAVVRGAPSPMPVASALDPVDVGGKTWQFRDYAWLCAALGLSPQSYLLGTLGLGLGLTWQWGLAAALGAGLLSALLAAATSHPSAKFGVPLSVALRPAFGPWGARVPALLSSLLALPWCAWLLLLAARALAAGIARFKPAAESWAPVPADALPRGHPSFLALLALLAAALALLLAYALGAPQGGPGAGSGTPTAARSLAGASAASLLGLYVGTAVWLGRALGVGNCLAAYDGLRSRASGDLPLYVALPLATLAGVGCHTSPLLLGYPDLARWAATRAAPRRALLLAFPLASTLAAASGMLITGGLAKGWSTPDATPPGPLRFESPPYMALLGGILLALATLHAALVAYLIPAGYALLEVLAGPSSASSSSSAACCSCLRLRSAVGPGSLFLLAALALAVFAPKALMGSYDFLSPSALSDDATASAGGSSTTGTGIPGSLSASLAPLALHGWSLTAGLVGGAVAGVLVGDYHLLRRKRLPAPLLYPPPTTTTRTDGGHHRGGAGGCGVNAAGMLALLAGFLPFAFRAAVLRALGDEWTGPELLPALSPLTTFPCALLAYALGAKCLSLTPWGSPSPSASVMEEGRGAAAAAAVSQQQRPARGRGPRAAAGGGPTAAGERAAGRGASASYPGSSRRNQQSLGPPGVAPVAAASQQFSASSRATEQLTATLHQLLLQEHPPCAPPTALVAADGLRPAPSSTSSSARFHHPSAPSPSPPPIPLASATTTTMTAAAAKPEGETGADEETKQAGELPRAYAVNVDDDEGEHGGGGGEHGGARGGWGAAGGGRQHHHHHHHRRR